MTSLNLLIRTQEGFIGRISEQKGILRFVNEFANHKDSFKDSVIFINKFIKDDMVYNLSLKF